MKKFICLFALLCLLSSGSWAGNAPDPDLGEQFPKELEILKKARPVQFVNLNLKSKISLVDMKAFSVIPVQESSRGYIGTYGLGPCIGVVIVSKTNGNIHRIGVAHVDATTKRIDDFISRSLKGADEVQISLIAGNGHLKTALRIINQLEESMNLAQNREYFVSLKGVSGFFVDIETGSVSKQSFLLGDETTETYQEKFK